LQHHSSTVIAARVLFFFKLQPWQVLVQSRFEWFKPSFFKNPSTSSIKGICFSTTTSIHHCFSFFFKTSKVSTSIICHAMICFR
jgi:hypothetical protein